MATIARSHEWRLAMMAAIALSASGCAATRPSDVVAYRNGKITVQRAPDQKVLLRVDDKPPVPVPGLKDAQIGLLWGAAKSNFVVLRGPTEDCPDAARIASITAGAISVHPLGACGDKLTFTQKGDTLMIRAVPAHGSATLIAFRDGDADAHAVEVAPARRTRSPGRGMPEHASPAPTVADTDTAVLAGELRVPVPAVSARVGDDVVPPPVGGGPLPTGADHPVLPFETSSRPTDRSDTSH